MPQILSFQNRSLILGDSLMEETLMLATRAAQSNSPVLLSGESGTGKELIARWIHERSARKNEPFVTVNCAALPEGLMEAELFGYEKGAFTGAIAQRIGKFERASRGTLLLDEISEMPVHLQAKLLRVLQEGEIDRLGSPHPIQIQTRVIATTNRLLPDLIRKNEFRSDLFYRLNVLRVNCPPLRGRKEAILNLTESFLRYFSMEEPFVLSESARDKILEHSWPGNIRELRNAVERAVLLAEGKKIGPEHIELEVFSNEIVPLSRLQTLAEIEQKHIFETLNHSEGNRTEAAKKLQISVRTLRNKLKEYRKSG